METCHICHEDKDIKQTENYCKECSPFICIECLEEWKKHNQLCPICKKPNQKENEVRIDIDNNIDNHIDNNISAIRTIQDNDEPIECTKMCIFTRTILAYNILFVSGAFHHIIFVLSEGGDVNKDIKKYIKQPIIYILCPLLGAYVLMLLFIVMCPIIYLVKPCFRQRITPLPQAEQVSQGASCSIVN